MTKLIDISSTV